MTHGAHAPLDAGDDLLHGGGLPGGLRGEELDRGAYVLPCTGLELLWVLGLAFVLAKELREDLLVLLSLGGIDWPFFFPTGLREGGCGAMCLSSSPTSSA